MRFNVKARVAGLVKLDESDSFVAHLQFFSPLQHKSDEGDVYTEAWTIVTQIFNYRMLPEVDRPVVLVA